MADPRRLFDGKDAATAVLYAKRSLNSEDAWPILVNADGTLKSSAGVPSRASSNGTTITGTTTAIISAPSTGNHIRIVRLHASNSGSTSTWVHWRDGASGTKYYPAYLPQNGLMSINLNTSGPLDLTTATRLDIVLSAAGTVEYQVDYFTVAD